MFLNEAKIILIGTKTTFLIKRYSNKLLYFLKKDIFKITMSHFILFYVFVMCVLLFVKESIQYIISKRRQSRN